MNTDHHTSRTAKNIEPISNDWFFYFDTGLSISWHHRCVALRSSVGLLIELAST